MTSWDWGSDDRFCELTGAWVPSGRSGYITSPVTDGALLILKRRMLTHGFHYVERPDPRQSLLRLGVARSPIVVRTVEEEEFQPEWSPDKTAEERIADIMSSGVRRAYAERWEFIPTHRIASISGGEPM
jgi:hypothetical protein